MSYEEAIDWLYGTQLFGIKLGLDPVRGLLAGLGLDRALEGRRVLHVAGTNGKGSVCALSDAILRAAGHRCGLFTSPHLVTFRERIRVDGAMIPEPAVAEGLTRIRQHLQGREPHPTFFEIALALALGHFAATDCDTLVLETGMGGRLDATNALRSDVAVITPIGLDHTQWLGDSLGAIAGEKAGIIEVGRPVLSALQPDEAAAVIAAAAREKGAPLRWVGPDEAPPVPVALSGAHQRANAALAVAAVRTLVPGLPDAAVARGLATVEWPARYQRVGDRIVIDGAHNAHAAAVLARTWREDRGPGARATVIFGGVAHKDTAETLRRLAPLAARWIFVKVASSRGLAVEELVAAWQSVAAEETAALPEIPWTTAATVAEALDLARRGAKSGAEAEAEADSDSAITAPDEDPILVTGSLYLAGEALAALLGGPPFEASEQ